MNKKISKIKRVLALCLIFLLSINSFAAIVSDNDGSAFVTKAEFDALKEDFNKQIDDYNTSIDGKIDGAIAAYLSGIKISTIEERKTLFSDFNVDYIESQKSTSAFKYQFGYTGFDINFLIGIGFTTGLGGSTGDVYCNYNSCGYGTLKRTPIGGKRILLEKVDGGSGSDYRFCTYAQNLKHTLTQTIFYQTWLQDTGFGGNTNLSWGGYFWNINNTNFKTRTEMLASQWVTQFTTYGSDWNRTERPFYTGHVETHVSSYTFDEANSYDFVFYSNDSDGNWLWSNQMKDENNYFTNYLDTTTSPITDQYNDWKNNWSTADFLYRQYHAGTTKQTWTSAVKENSYSVAKWKMGKYGVPVAAPILNLNNYSQIYHKDNTKYVYTDETGGSGSLQNYKMTAGIPFLDVQKDTQVKWIPKFNELKNKRIYFNYGPFENESEPSASTLLKSSVDNGSTYNNFSIVSDRTEILLNIEKPGLIFVKWKFDGDIDDGGGQLDVEASSVAIQIKND